MALKSQVSLSRSLIAIIVFLLMSQLMSCECFLVAFSVIVKAMIVPAEMFVSWHCIGIFDIFLMLNVVSDLPMY